MSYCRWSSDDFKSDIYAYESEQGFETWVAGNRIVGEVPHVDWDESFEEFAAQRVAQRAFLRNVVREPIGLPHDGEFFLDDNLDDFEERLRALAALGYNVPASAFDIIASERASSLTGKAACS